MKNEVFYPNDPSDKLSLPVAADTASGAFVLVGDQGLFGVTATAEGEGGNAAGYASVWTAGVYNLPVTTTTAADIGDKVYAVTASGNLTPADGSGANIHVGWFLEAKGTTAGEVVRIKLAKV
jgi:predicted RecA/RadA family phage recombinase